MLHQDGYIVGMRRRLISRLGNGFLLPLARFCALVGAEPPAPLGAPERKIGTARSAPAAQRWHSRNVAIANVSDRAPHCLESKKELEFSSGASFNADSISIGWLRAITGRCRFPSSEARPERQSRTLPRVATGATGCRHAIMAMSRACRQGRNYLVTTSCSVPESSSSPILKSRC